MRHAPLALLLLVAACAGGPKQREMQYAEGIKTAQRALITAIDFDLVTLKEGEAIQAMTRTVTADLKRAIAARRAGTPQAQVDRILEIVLGGIIEINRLLAERKS